MDDGRDSRDNVVIMVTRGIYRIVEEQRRFNGKTLSAGNSFSAVTGNDISPITITSARVFQVATVPFRIFINPAYHRCRGLLKFHSTPRICGSLRERNAGDAVKEILFECNR